MGEFGTTGDNTKDQFSVNVGQQPDYEQYAPPPNARSVRLQGNVTDTEVRTQLNYAPAVAPERAPVQMQGGVSDTQLRAQTNLDNPITPVPTACRRIEDLYGNLNRSVYPPAYKEVFITENDFGNVCAFSRNPEATNTYNPWVRLYDGNGYKIRDVQTREVGQMFQVRFDPVPLSINEAPNYSNVQAFHSRSGINEAKVEREAGRLIQKYGGKYGHLLNNVLKSY